MQVDIVAEKKLTLMTADIYHDTNKDKHINFSSCQKNKGFESVVFQRL